MSADAVDDRTADADELAYDDPRQVGRDIAECPRPLLIGLDIDGVLSPIVAHADDAALSPGVADCLERLVTADGVTVAAISGRALSSIRTFGLPAGVLTIGSHGLESGDHAFEPLDVDEQRRLDQLIIAADAAASAAGAGSWVEHKQASVAVHTREADPDAGRAALETLTATANDVAGAGVKPGSEVLELFARHASKGTAITGLARTTGAATTVFIGDDVTDEEAFAALDERDVTIKVGTADTIAGLRLRDPADVVDFLTALTAACLA